VRDPELLARAVDGVDRVAHLASIAGVGTVLSRPYLTMHVAVEGTLRLLDAIERRGTSDVRRLVLFSTSEVFGRFAHNVSETDPTPIGPVEESRWTYACAKAATEHLAHAFGREKGLPVVSLRPFNVYGPRQVGEGAIQRFIRQAVAGEDLVVHNDGRQIRAWCYVTDMVDATLAALERDEAVGHAFNIGNPATSVTVLTLAEAVKRVSGSSSRIRFERRDYPDVEIRMPLIDRARELLLFEPAVGLEEGIAETFRWFQENAR
jgi:nucleoside-diphosphate-sugar epimerase